MEGMPRVPMLTPDLKFYLAPFPTDFSSKIKEYILLHYQDDPAKYDSAIGEIENMRSKLSRILPDSETLTLLQRYYSQLCLMKNRFPMEKEDSIDAAFSWMDKGSDTSNAAVFADINYELTCVLHNIGAVHGAIAANEKRADLDSVKNAFMHFQCAAYPFGQIRDSMNAVKYSTVDFDPSVLTFYVTILLAQAQECLLEKSIIDHRKNTVIAKLAIHLKDVYVQCREYLDFTGLNDVLSSKYKEWLRTCTIKSEMYGAIAMLHLGLQAEDDNRMGFRVSYFDLALERATAAMKYVEKDKRESLREAIIFLNDIVLGKQRNAKKENDFIYHERTPKPEELPITEGVNMVKAVGFDPADKSISGPDLFAALLPGNVVKSLSIYSEQKAKFKRALLEEIEEKDKELENYIESLQLGEINFDDESKIEELPEMLLERSAAFNSQPDTFLELLDKLHRVGDFAIEADHKISDLRSRLDAVNSPHLKADEGFSAVMKELDRMNDHHTKARTNNAELQRALAAHSESLTILAMPFNELRKRLIDTQTKPADSAEGLLLKKMLDKANEMITQRRALISKLTEDLQNDDITVKCLAEKNEDNQRLYENELKKHKEIATLIHMNLAAQENILSVLTDANAGFGDYRKKIVDENKNRMDQVLALTAAFDVYVDVSQKTEEGLKFYSTLFTMLNGLREAVEAVEAAFEEEKKEREKKMLQELEKRATASAKWDTTAQNIKKVEEHILTSSGNLRNENTSESGHNGLRLKDCLEYYRNNIAKGTTKSDPKFLNCGTRQPQSISMPSVSRGNEILSKQTVPTSNTVQLSKYPVPLSLQSHFGTSSNHCVPNNPFNSMAKETPQTYMVSENVSLPSHPQQAGNSLGLQLGSQSQITASLMPQHAESLPNHFSSLHRIPTFQNQNAIDTALAVANTQQVNTTLQPLTLLSHGTYEPISSAVTTDSGRGASFTPQNVPSSSATPSISSHLNYVPKISYASNSALPQQPVLTQRLGANPIAATELKKIMHGTVLNAQVYSAFAPNTMHSSCAGNMAAAGATSALNKPAIVPAHHLMYPQDARSYKTMSPWHQPLGNINNRVTCTSASAAGFQPLLPNIQAAPTGSTSAVDIMNAPLDVVLPTPLTPTHRIVENKGRNSSVQMIANSAHSAESTRIEEKKESAVQMLETVGSSSISSTVVQTPRPAAAVAPIMQTDCITTSVSDSTLSITNVTSMSYSAPLSQAKTAPQCAGTYTRKENGSANEGFHSRVQEVMYPQTFTIGGTDPVRLEKRYMREQFKTEGTNAHLPPLDRNDPINHIDAHYWLDKS